MTEEEYQSKLIPIIDRIREKNPDACIKMGMNTVPIMILMYDMIRDGIIEEFQEALKIIIQYLIFCNEKHEAEKKDSPQGDKAFKEILEKIKALSPSQEIKEED